MPSSGSTLRPRPRDAGAPPRPRREPEPGPRFEPVGFDAIAGFARDDLAAAFAAFRRSARALREGAAPLRAARAPSPGLRAALTRALDVDPASPEAFFQSAFTPLRVAAGGFFTGYYEPLLEASPTRGAEFPVPVLGPPAPSDAPLPDRTAILAGALDGRALPILWVRDEIELFMAQVQGSARARLPDGRTLRLTYAGRNGLPYRSIGRLLIERGEIAAEAMSLAALKAFVRAAGQGPGEAGAALMRENPSYVFFAASPCAAPAEGPTGGAGLPLTPLRSLAIDRALYAYGTPVFVEADLPAAAGGPLARLMIAQDVGSAIVGEGRGDIFFGCGEEAGAKAGATRHEGAFVALVPKGEEGIFA